MQNEKKYWVQFLAIDGIGGKTFLNIKNFCHQNNIDLAEAWRKPEILLLGQILTEKKISLIKDFQKQYSDDNYFDYLSALEIYLITLEDESYPELLSQISDPPQVLYCKGKNLFTSSQIKKTVAVVGTRQVTAYGRMVTDKITTDLVNQEMMIISGCMYGVDMVAHQTALDENGQTIGVLGYGFEHCYPASAKKFFQDFLDRGGMLITEFAPYVFPQPGNFPSRNRIVAGLARGVVVTEAAKKSGSHITARLAVDDGRSVYAVPGPINNPYSQGTKWLINQGALLITNGAEVVEDLRFNIEQQDEVRLPKGENIIQDQIIQAVAIGEKTTDQLSKELEIEAGNLGIELTLLELAGLIHKSSGKWFLK